MQLLDGTPQGVFQLGQYLIGPFGLIKSPHIRYNGPTTKFQLWHCSDPACSYFHEVELTDSDSCEILEVYSEVYRLKGATSPEFEELYTEANNQRAEYYDDTQLKNIYEILVNAFGQEELRLLLISLMDTTNLRAHFPNLKKLKGSSDKICNALQKAECVQLILLCSDSEIVFSLEKLLHDKTIIIPSTEVRESKEKKYFGQYDIFHQCNELGVRAVAASKNLSLVRLKRLLLTIYSDLSIIDQLEWKLRKYPEENSFEERLERYIHEESPARLISETIMNSQMTLEKAFEKFPGFFFTPNTEEAEKIIIEKFLWKLGFRVDIYPDISAKFWEYFGKFKDTVYRSVHYTRNDKEEIRSAAANFFVSLEEILEHTLSFITWALLSDHYLETGFIFVYEDAREMMAGHLNGFEYKKGEHLSFDSSGKNTFFPLVEGFNALISICDKTIGEAPSNYTRPTTEFPHFYKKDPLRTFPFEHKRLILDIRQKDYVELKELLAEIPKEFNRANVLSMRNALHHKRDKFPTQDELAEACSCVEKVILKLENLNVFPNVYLFKENQTDQYNRGKILFENYKHGKLYLYPTMNSFDLKQPYYTSPQIIVPALKLKTSGQPIRFAYSQRSDYQQYWKGYPRKKPKTGGA